MKKLAIGCLVLVVLAGAVMAGVAYYAYRQVRSTVAQFAELGQIAEIERGVRVKDPFVAPASAELTSAQLQHLIRIQQRVRERLGAKAAEFERKYKALSDKKDMGPTDLPTLIAGYRDLVGLFIDAKRTQVEALNDAGLSLEEYHWIRTQAYRAAGIPFVDFDIGKLVDDIRNNRTVEQPGRIEGSLGGPTGPDVNRKLIEPVKKQLEDNLALASFGL